MKQNHNLTLLLALVLVLLFFVSVKAVAQDTLFQTPTYKSYYSYKYNQPICVEYKLYKGGGSCDRRKLQFRLDGYKLNIGAADYVHSGYDKGHLANAEDFAGDCAKEELTFRFYNCLPQNPHLNRGVWKKNETWIREKSQTDSLLVYCGGLFDTTYTFNKLIIPYKCFKVVKSLSTYKYVFIGIFDNTDSAFVHTYKYLPEQLQKIIHQ